MNRAALLAVLFLVSLASEAIAQSNWTATLRGAGPIRFGMPVSEARASGVRLAEGSNQTRECSYVVPEDGPSGLFFMVEDGRIVAAMAYAGSVRTRSGVGAGSFAAEVRRVYASHLRTVSFEGEYEEPRLVYVPYDADDRNYRLVFHTKNGYVDYFLAGLLPSVESSGECFYSDTWPGRLLVEGTRSSINYVGSESGDRAPFYFRTRSPVGTQILAACRHEDICEVTALVRWIEDVPEMASAAAEILAVRLVRRLGR